MWTTQIKEKLPVANNKDFTRREDREFKQFECIEVTQWQLDLIIFPWGMLWEASKDDLPISSDETSSNCALACYG